MFLLTVSEGPSTTPFSLLVALALYGVNSADLGMTSPIFLSCREICTVFEGRREAQSRALVLEQLARDAGLLAHFTGAGRHPGSQLLSSSRSCQISSFTFFAHGFFACSLMAKDPSFPAGHQQHQACRW